jgi:glycosyltransferase involved in cell wall biosynthesis
MEVLFNGKTEILKMSEHSNINEFTGRVGIIQRVLPAYRAGFFNALAYASSGGASVFAGSSRSGESIRTADQLNEAKFVLARNWELFHPHSTPYLLWQAGLFRWLNAWDPDILVAEANARYLSVRAAARWMHKRGRPVVGWGLGVPMMEAAASGGNYWARTHDKLWKIFLSSFYAMISYSQTGALQYRQAGLPAKRVFVAPNAVAPQPEGPPPQRPPRFEGNPKVMFVGRLQRRKRIDNLLRACASLPESIQPRVWIIGDGPAKREFQSLAADLYPQAIFFGAVRGPALRDYFAQADLFVLPGTGGLAVQEAMAAGLPVVVAEGDGSQADMVRVCTDKRCGNGWLIPPADLSALEQALRAALSDPERLRRMGAESYRMAVEEHNLENMVRVFIEALTMVKTSNI